MITDGFLMNILYALPFKIRQGLYNISPEIQKSITEIRLRKNRPLALTVSGSTLFLTPDGQTRKALQSGLLIADERDISDCFRLLCDDSVFAHENELKNGFISLKNGCRAGVCGRLSGGIMQDITSLNIRISREVKGCADGLLNAYGLGGLLIAGPPASGKTTLLRDLVRQLSDCKGFRCAVIDSRGEIGGGGQLDLGDNTDVLICDDKATGIEIALRTLSPDFIVFDEIGTLKELEAVSQSFFSGVKIITTAHISSRFELESREITSRLLKGGGINQIALLTKKVGDNFSVFSVKEIYHSYAF